MSDPASKRRQAILDAAADAARDFLVYDRKEDEDLPIDSVEEAIADGDITLDEIVAAFREDLKVWGQLDD